MASPKQRAANRHNALLSTGPRTEDGQRRASINALKHGLTTSIELTPWASAVGDVEVLLAAEGFAAPERHELAVRIVEYERNMAFQRRQFMGDAVKPAPANGVSVQMQEDLQELADLIEFVDADDDPAVLRFAASQSRKIVALHERIAAKHRKVAAREAADVLRSGDRYYRRAANQLIKQLKGMGGR